MRRSREAAGRVAVWELRLGSRAEAWELRLGNRAMARALNSTKHTSGTARHNREPM